MEWHAHSRLAGAYLQATKVNMVRRTAAVFCSGLLPSKLQIREAGAILTYIIHAGSSLVLTIPVRWNIHLRVSNLPSGLLRTRHRHEQPCRRSMMQRVTSWHPDGHRSRNQSKNHVSVLISYDVTRGLCCLSSTRRCRKVSTGCQISDCTELQHRMLPEAMG